MDASQSATPKTPNPLTRLLQWSKNPAQLGAILAFFAVAFGAFGTHSLRDFIEPARLATFETGVRYQMYHALGLLALGALPSRLHRAAIFLFSGSIIFSGSLYLLALSGWSLLGAVAPIGGALQLLGWAVLFFSFRSDAKL